MQGDTRNGGGFVFFFGAARLWFGLARFGLVWRAKRHRRKQQKLPSQGGRLFFLRVRLGLGLAWLGSAWLGGPRCAEEKQKKCRARAEGFFLWCGLAWLGLAWLCFLSQAKLHQSKTTCRANNVP